MNIIEYMKQILNFILLICIFLLLINCSSGDGSNGIINNNDDPADNVTDYNGAELLEVYTSKDIFVDQTHINYGYIYIINHSNKPINKLSYQISNYVGDAAEVLIDNDSMRKCTNIESNTSCVLKLKIAKSVGGNYFNINIKNRLHDGKLSEINTNIIGLEEFNYAEPDVVVISYYDYIPKNSNKNMQYIIINGVLTNNIHHGSISGITVMQHSNGSNIPIANQKILSDNFISGHKLQIGDNFSILVPTKNFTLDQDINTLELNYIDNNVEDDVIPQTLYKITAVGIKEPIVAIIPTNIYLQNIKTQYIAFSNIGGQSTNLTSIATADSSPVSTNISINGGQDSGGVYDISVNSNNFYPIPIRELKNQVDNTDVVSGIKLKYNIQKLVVNAKYAYANVYQNKSHMKFIYYTDLINNTVMNKVGAFFIDMYFLGQLDNQVEPLITNFDDLVNSGFSIGVLSNNFKMLETKCLMQNLDDSCHFQFATSRKLAINGNEYKVVDPNNYTINISAKDSTKIYTNDDIKIHVNNFNAISPLFETGQTKSFPTTFPSNLDGVDGKLQMGLPLFVNVKNRFKPLYNESCIMDTKTHLLWNQKTSHYAKGESTAESIFYMVSNNNLQLCNNNTWRLPNVNELMSMYNFGDKKKIDYITNSGFAKPKATNQLTRGKDISYNDFIMSSIIPSSIDYNFLKLLIITTDATSLFDVIEQYSITADSIYDTPTVSYDWLVTDITSNGDPIDNGIPESLAQTGQNKTMPMSIPAFQTVTLNTDGNNQSGVKWDSSTRFESAGVGNGCILDKLTGLVWTKNANLLGNISGFNDAIRAANDMNHNLSNPNYRLCNHNDWRIPNYTELNSMINYGYVDQQKWLSSVGFINSENKLYCTSTVWFFIDFNTLTLKSTPICNDTIQNSCKCFAWFVSGPY